VNISYQKCKVNVRLLKFFWISGLKHCLYSPTLPLSSVHLVTSSSTAGKIENSGNQLIIVIILIFNLKRETHWNYIKMLFWMKMVSSWGTVNAISRYSPCKYDNARDYGFELVGKNIYHYQRLMLINWFAACRLVNSFRYKWIDWLERPEN